MAKFKHYFNFQNFFAFVIFIFIYVYFYRNHDNTINETYKNILLIIAGYIFGSSKSSANKDETIKALQDNQKGSIVGETVETQNITVKEGTITQP